MPLELLDCTLRDGTYVNDGRFGFDTIKKIISKLNNSNIDIIECGWLTDCNFDPSKTFFPSIEDFEIFVPENKKSKFSLMLYHDKYDFKKISKNRGRVDIIREIFHKTRFKEAVYSSGRIKDLGYNLFYQVVNTNEYSNRDLMELSGLSNKILPDCIYIVDTHGGMFFEDLKRIFEILDENLDDKIKIGFHSHNNLQLSFALAIKFIEMAKKRNIVLDSSLFGMGRGAGNLNSELIAEYLNKFWFKNYDLDSINKLITEEILNFKTKCDWGYSIPYLLSGSFGIHSRYAKYLIEKYDINPDALREVFSFLNEQDKKVFKKNSADDAYKKAEVR